MIKRKIDKEMSNKQNKKKKMENHIFFTFTAHIFLMLIPHFQSVDNYSVDF